MLTERVLDAATDLILRAGYGATSLGAVAAAERKVLRRELLEKLSSVENPDDCDGADNTTVGDVQSLVTEIAEVALSDVLLRLTQRAPVDVPVALIAAHPDDETIGAGASLHLFRRLLLVHVTDGAPRRLQHTAATGFVSAVSYAEARRRELKTALDIGGADPELAILGAPDQEASLQLADLTAALACLLRQHDTTCVITHPYEGGHPDHDAAAFVTHRAAARAHEPEILEMTSYHAEPDGGVATACFLPNGPFATVIALSEAEQARKRAMLKCFVSQHLSLDQFGTGREPFRPAPRYDFTAPPHSGMLHYERGDQRMTGARWRELAARALA